MKEVLNVTFATTKIKEIVSRYVAKGEKNSDAMNYEIKKVIAECCKNIPDKNEQKTVANSLWQASRKWIYELSQTYAIADKSVISKLVRLGALNQSYSVDFFGSGNILDRFRPLLEGNKDVTVPIIDRYEKSVRLAIKAMSADPPKVVRYVTKSGKQVTYPMSLRNRAEMKVRYEANLKDLVNVRNQGIKLVWTSSHPNCSPRCKNYQGKLWSLDGTSGTINGKNYEPIERALRGPLGDGNGIISGYNCRHRLIPYEPGSNPPTDYTEAEIKREYALDRKLTGYENAIRQKKVEEKLLRANGNLEAAKELRKEWRRLTKRYEIESLRNGRAFYRWRCVVSEDEKDYSDNNLTKEDKNDKIEESLVSVIGNEIERLKQNGEVNSKIGITSSPVKRNVTHYVLNDHAKKRITERLSNRDNINNEIQSYIDEALVMFKQNKGDTLVYYSVKGCIVINLSKKLIKTVYSKKDFDPAAKKIIEVTKRFRRIKNEQEK